MKDADLGGLPPLLDDDLVFTMIFCIIETEGVPMVTQVIGCYFWVEVQWT